MTEQHYDAVDVQDRSQDNSHTSSRSSASSPEARSAKRIEQMGPDEAETTSSSGSDTSDDDDDNQHSETEQAPHTQMEKPSMLATDQNNIHSRLTNFFSQLAQQRNEGGGDDDVIERLSDDDEDEGYEEGDEEEEGRQYVEINLALGVLSEEDADGGDEIRLPSKVEEDNGDGVLPNLKSITEQSAASKAKAKRKIEEVV
ncbi:hypothetical protein H2198_003699 [Neophaeococcomyces mojaviensis]|uniref:Uncharacterized protein n=1 Tax=Neophaeococcomyces mojaviensis TaxID=3383035 RepID=A0ACC3ABF5_9EURO|nr:hypothetical protein H2198_003699 [Knufia sp. JES_112]